MNFDMKRPCAECPFLRSVPGFLHPARAAEIVEAITVADGTFSCHKTVEYANDWDGVNSAQTQHCAGALIFLEKLGRPNQMMRIAERLGWYDLRRLDMSAEVFAGADEMVRHHAESRPPKFSFEAPG